MSENISYERYNRQMLLKNFGEAGQKKLTNASVLVVGAGGLGCPVLQYLAAAGVGKIGVVDDDVVAITNLHRQVLFSVEDVGYPKVEIAVGKLKKMNPEISITAFNQRLNVENAIDIMSEFDV
ncbi:MAG TPA: HesA/MoeB/ThiF family protein, partial [Chitinophagaceae bacterium]|nr:HesA/MoeB/ThiF family protein [Chitinophagaceae bacterium]